MFLLAFLISSVFGSTKSYMPHPTAKSGVPSPSLAGLTCGIAVVIIIFAVSILCIKKTTDNEAFGSRQILLSQPDI